MTAEIARVHAREVLDSRGRPTVEADVVLVDGTLGRASVPSGASTGRHEAIEVRDGERQRYGGLGVRQAVRNVNDILGPGVVGLNPSKQSQIDAELIDLDGTTSKRRLGANAVLAVSLAACRAAATAKRVPLYRHIAELSEVARPVIPLPMVNILSGGAHAGGQIDIQDVLVIPLSARSFAEAIEEAAAVHRSAAQLQSEGRYPPLVADEGGWAPPLNSNEDALRWVAEASERAGLQPGVDVALAVDVAASQFSHGTPIHYQLSRDKRDLDADGMVQLLKTWVERYPLRSIEDGLGEDDWDGWRLLTDALGRHVQLLGDDLFATRPERLELGIGSHVANAVLVKVNQIGTLSEALQVVQRAQAAGYRVVASARSGETEDSFLADLAVGCAAGQIKVGSVTRSSRLAKWNQLLRIEEDLGVNAYAGAAALG